MNKVIIAHIKEDLNMQFLKNFFKHDDIIVGLSGLRKRKEYVRIRIPKSYKQTFIANTEQNYLLF